MQRQHHNLSRLNDETTARTDPECAAQRAEHLAALGATSVIELCVGPSLRVLEKAYATHGIKAAGNDIERRWQRYYPEGSWIIGDALQIDWSAFDAVVFAPPVTQGCTGRREDSLQIDQVFPRYRDFLHCVEERDPKIAVLVLPARATATSVDRRQYHALLASIRRPYSIVPLHAERRQIRKYNDVYLH